MAIFQAGGSHPRPLSFRGMYLNLLHFFEPKKTTQEADSKVQEEVF